MLISERIPITVGVVGHLDVITTDKHKLQIEKLFTDLAEEYQNSPIWLFSSIAEGADRYVANLFLELKKNNEKYRQRFELIVPIPFETEEYKRDFDEASDLAYDELIRQAKRSFSVGNCEKEVDRPQEYLKTGKLVADSSLILIALWDGEEGKKGGTADIVKYKITGDDDTVAESTFDYDGIVFIMPTSRRKSSPRASIKQGYGNPLSLEQILKDPVTREALEKIEEINSDIANIKDTDPGSSQSLLIKSPEKLNPQQESILSWYSALDILAQHFRKKDVRITQWLFTLGLFLILALEIYSNILLSRWVLVTAMLILAVAVLVYIYSRRAGYHKKYLYNRTLAEALRIQFYWNFAGMQENVSNYILRIHRKEFSWVKHILSAIYGATFSNKTITPEAIKYLTSDWIRNQTDFFESSVIKMTRRINLSHKVSNLSFLTASVIFASILFLGDYYESNGHLNFLLVIIGILLGFFALIRAYIQLKGYEQLLNQYELMEVIYQRADRKINEINNSALPPQGKLSYLKELFIVIGKEALIENGNWYLIFKEKEPEIEGI
jgi:hypothetical protein